MDKIKTDICIIGAGSGGLSVAAGAAQMGADTVLIEKAKMGGDCLNYGCVPSKALLAAGKQAHRMRNGGHFGIAPVEPMVDFGLVNDHVHNVIAAIEPNDSVERFEGMGVNVIRDNARFIDPYTVEAGGIQIRARKFVVATGSRATAPPIAGLDQMPFMTNETIFSLRECPEHLIIIGGGPIGIEMAQAHRRLGARVTVLEAFTALAKDDPDLTKIVLSALRSEGVDIRENVKISLIERVGQMVRVRLDTEAGPEYIDGSHLLVAAGRAPNVDGLDLELAGIEYTRKGIEVDAGLKTTNKRVYAIGDVAGGLQFTHVAGYHAGVVIKNALFKMPAKADHTSIPWVTYTDPELAHVGLTEASATARYGSKARVLHWPLAENDRAQAEGETEGLIKAIVHKKGHILGASIVGPHAGDLILPWVLALSQKMKISAFTSMVAPYPTFGEISKRAASAFYTPTLFGDRTKRIVRLLRHLG